MKRNFLTLISFLLLSGSNAWAQPIQGPQTGLQKIEQALEQNQITQADAAGFRVLFYFQSPALPSRFQSDFGAPSVRPSDNLLSEAREEMPSMELTLAEEVYSLMIPPPFRASEDKAEKNNDTFPTPSTIPNRLWTYTESDRAKLRIWFKRDDFAEERLAMMVLAMLENEIIPAVEKLMGMRHDSDALEDFLFAVRPGVFRTWPNGGDGKLDVYIFDFPVEPDKATPWAWVKGYPSNKGEIYSCPASPSYMGVNRSWALSTPTSKLASTLAHEYFHVIQSLFNRKGNCKFYKKMDEGTANYAEHYVYPDSNDEHDWFMFSEDGNLSLINESYSTWPFYLFMTKTQGEGSLLSLYQTMEGFGAYEALDRTLDGGFKKQWLDYAVHEWNQDPIKESFLQWDNYTSVPGRGGYDADGHMNAIVPEKVVLDAKGAYSYPMYMLLPPLTRNFFAFDLSDENIRSVAFDNPIYDNRNPKINLNILARKRGTDSYDELLWQDDHRKHFLYCLDKKDQNYDLLVVVAANYEHSINGDTYSPSPEIRITNKGCYGYKGTLKGYTVHPRGNFRLDVQVNDFEVREQDVATDGDYRNRYIVVGGSATYKAVGTIGNCETNSAGSVELKIGSKQVGVTLQPYVTDPTRVGIYNVEAALKNGYVEVPFKCKPPQAGMVQRMPFILNTAMQIPYPDNKGKPELVGELSTMGFNISWDLKPIKEE